MPPGQSLDLYNYTLTAQYDRPTSTAANRLASETSAVTYNRDSGNLFVIGDEGTAIVELTRGGVLVGSMAFATPLDDTEGIAWIDDNQFVVSEERTRTIKRLEYTGGTTLAAGAISAVKIGTTIDNIGIEGISYDPLDDGYVMVKEKDPLGLFFTEIDFGAGTASNGSPTTIDSTNLFNPALAGVTDFSDIYALSNVLPPVAQDVEDLLVVGQENGVLLKMDRSGNIRSRLNVGIPAQHEGVAADENGIIYMANELGGGNGMPQLWVYTPTTSPTAVGIGSRLFLSFATNVSAGTGNIALSNGAGDTRSIAIGDTSQITFSGRTVTVDLATDLVPGSTYSVTAPAGLIRATTGGARSSAINTGFATRGDSLAPRLSSSIPADNAAGIVSSRIELQFNESVRAGTGDIVISDGMSDTRTIAVGDATQVTITGASVVIVPTLPLSSLTAYNVQMAAGVVEDLSGNDFVGLTTPTALNFTTANIGGAPPSTLNAGDILFMGINGDATDAFAFVLLVDITAGTQIQFTDKDYSETAPNWPSNESAITWTADVDYPAGTIVTIQPDALLTDLGSVVGISGGVGTTSETYYAFQGTITNPTANPADITVDRFLALIYLGSGPSGAYPQAIVDADADIYFGTEDNVKYDGSLDRSDLAAFAALVRDPGNWVSNDTVGYPLINGSLFGTAMPSTGTELAVGDIAFMGINSSNPEAFAFVLLKPVEATTKILFTDKNYSNSTSSFPGNEAAITWTADVDYPAGTIVTIQPSSTPVTDLGTVSGTGGGISPNEVYYAFQGTITDPSTTPAGITVDRFIASISLGTPESDIPATLSGVSQNFAGFSNVKYNGSLDRKSTNLATFTTAVRTTSNWQNSGAAFAFPGGHLFGGSDLSVGGVLFMAVNADNEAPDNDAFAFVLIEAVTAGTEIAFTDKDYVVGSPFPINESAFIWTADQAYAAGTIVSVRANALTVDKGTLYGKSGGVGNGETYYAFKGQVIDPDSGALIVYRFLSAIHVADVNASGQIPTSLTAAGAYIEFALDNVKYVGSLDRSNIPAFAALVKNPAEWSGSDTDLFPLTGGSFFP